MKFSVSTIKWFGYYKRIFVYKTMELMRHMFRLAVAILLAFAAGVQAQLVTYPEGLATGMPHNDDYTVRYGQSAECLDGAVRYGQPGRGDGEKE